MDSVIHGVSLIQLTVYSTGTGLYRNCRLITDYYRPATGSGVDGSSILRQRRVVLRAPALRRSDL